MPRFGGPQFPQSQDSAANTSQTITLAAPAAPVGQQSQSVYWIVTYVQVYISAAAAGADISCVLSSGSRVMWKGWIGSGAARGASVSAQIPIDGWPAEPGLAVTLVVGAGGAGCVTTANIAATYG